MCADISRYYFHYKYVAARKIVILNIGRGSSWHSWDDWGSQHIDFLWFDANRGQDVNSFKGIRCGQLGPSEWVTLRWIINT